MTDLHKHSFDLCAHGDPCSENCAYAQEEEQPAPKIFPDGEKLHICPICHGEGKYVNPNVDGNGLTQEDFDEEPDFRENYFSGMYDVTCKCCNGKRVITLEDQERYEGQLEDRDTFLAESGIYEGRGDSRL